MNKQNIATKIILTLSLVLGLQYLGVLGYSMTDSVGCLAGPLWIFAYIFDIALLMFWFFPIMFLNMTTGKLLLLAIGNIIVFIGVFYGVAFLFSDILI